MAKKKIKLLLINAVNVKKQSQTFLPSLGLGYLVSSLEQHFDSKIIETKIIDRNVEEIIGRFQPDIVGISSVSQNYNLAIKYAKIAKRYKLPVVVGGFHITLLPQTLAREMDIGVLGEGEITLVELMELYLKKGCFSPKDLKGIKGIVFRKKGRLIITPKRELIKPLDRIPFPARGFMSITNPAHMFTSRGCPYRCTFCSSSRFWQQVRFFSAKYVVEEIKFLHKQYGITDIDFWDDLFIADRNRLKEIYLLLKKEHLLGRLSFGCSARSNLVDEELAKLLRKMNIKRVSMGLESASPKILAYLKGNTIKVSDHRRAVNILNRYNIEVSASFIIGSPKETKTEILNTLNFIKKNRLRGFNVYLLTPLPGTPVWEYAKREKLVSENIKDWSILNPNFDQNYQKAIILSRNLGREELRQAFMMFKKEKTRKLLSYAAKHPLKIPPYLFRQTKKTTSRLIHYLATKK